MDAFNPSMDIVFFRFERHAHDAFRLTTFCIPDAQNHKGLEAPEDGWMDLDNHPTTTDEIRSLMSDLGVLGKADFKILLRWRMTIRKEAGLEKKKHQKGRRGQTEDSSDESSEESSGDEDEASDGDDDDDEGKDQLLNEMSELKSSMDAQARRDKKKKAKIKAKERLRVARGLASSGEAIVEQEMDLFSLARIKTKGALDVVSKAPTPGLGAAYDSDEEPDAVGEDSDAESDSEEEERRLDREVDDMWEMYKARRMKKGEKFTEPSKGRDKRTQLGAGELDDEDEDEDEDASDPADDEFKSDSDELEWEDDEEEEEEEVPKSKRNKTKKDSNPLVVDLGTKRKKNAAKAADMWFSNDLFSSDKKSAVAATDLGSESDEEDEPPAKEKKKSAKSSKKRKGAAADEEEENFDDLRAKAREAKEKKAKADAKVANAKRGKGARDDTYDDESDEETTRQKGRKGANDFEVVAAEEDVATGSESDSGYEYDSEVDELSDDTRARILALGQKMIRKKDREELIEDAYNRYAFDDDDVPDWFAEDERRFMKPIPQYTAAEFAEAKAQLAAVNTRPIKKVAEANWRKKKRAEAKIAQARVRAAAIIEQDDVPDVSKAKEIERVFAKARRSAAGGVKKPRKVVVARKYHRGNAGGPSVDKRQLADLRGQRASAKRAGKGGRGRGKGKGKGGRGRGR
jgi:AdoMet-dependent rRNA methyltransferase SPB1|tara:strand:+ start:6419 stop:8479 length:2061 start_codon:yes stop_codon:yes gene_type:complete